MKYRADVDGLRALAILPVVLFHAGLGGFRGGFVGVDVFFVVSGYLITTLIADEINYGRFSLVSFYERRVRRIFPALFTVVLFSSLAATTILLPTDLQSFGRSVVATALFGSNILFWSESGYFDAAAEAKPLLHTWSLAVEEQFYIVFPLFVLAAHRIWKGKWALAMLPIILTSFAFSVWAVSKEPAGAFYLAHFRAWELLLGALAATGIVPVLQRPLAREAESVLGLVMLAGGSLAFSSTTPFPGVAALLPCLGTLMLLHGSGVDTAVGRFLSCRALVFVGLVSYPLYLWHWPLLVFARRVVLRDLTTVETLIVVVCSFVLATLSWKFVEQPIRRKRNASGGSKLLFAGAAAALFVSVSVGAVFTKAPHEVARQGGYTAQPIRGREDYRDGNCFMAVDQSYSDWGRLGSCFVDNHAARTVLIWGDSFAAHYIPGLVGNPKAETLNFVQYSAYSCPPVLGARIPWAPNCQDFNNHLKEILEEFDIDSVVVVARWERYWGKHVSSAMLADTLAHLGAQGLAVVLVGQGPSFEFADPAEYSFRTGSNHSRSKSSDRINAELRSIRGYNSFLDPNQSLCPGGDCWLTSGGQFLYWDSGHYSTYGSQMIAGDLLDAIDAGFR